MLAPSGVNVPNNHGQWPTSVAAVLTGYLASHQTAFGRACFTQQWVNYAPVFLHHHQRLGMRAQNNLKKRLAGRAEGSQALARMKDNTTSPEGIDKSEVAVVLPFEMVEFIHDKCEEAASIMEGFLSRFEEPSCKEQQEVVGKATRWVKAFRMSKSMAKQEVAMMKAENN